MVKNKMKEVLKYKDITEQNMNDFFRNLKSYCKSNEKESFVPAGFALDIDKKDILIFEVDIGKVDFLLGEKQKKKKLILPLDKTFIEIPKWKIEDEKNVMVNIGGVLLYKQTFGDRLKGGECIEARTFWGVFNKETGRYILKPISVLFPKGIYLCGKEDFENNNSIIKMGSSWKKEKSWSGELLNDQIKKEMGYIIRNLVFFILTKIEKKEYTSYKKWTPRGFETKEIVYSHDVITHKRHFWTDSGRFKIPLLGKSKWEDMGYGTDELVFRNGEVRRDVPFRMIGNFVVGIKKEKKAENRRIKVAKGRIFRQEEKIYLILKEIFPNNIIRRHDRRRLKGLELDFYLPELKLGIEYDGEQHFDRKLCEEVFKSDFDAQVKRDRKKDQLCRRKKIKLIRIKYDELLTKTYLKKKLIC